MPPTPILRDENWPLLTVSKGFFENLAAKTAGGEPPFYPEYGATRRAVYLVLAGNAVYLCLAGEGDRNLLALGIAVHKHLLQIVKVHIADCKQ